MNNKNIKYIVAGIAGVVIIGGFIITDLNQKKENDIMKGTNDIQEIYVEDTKENKIVVEQIRKSNTNYWIATVENKTDKNIVKAGFANDKYKDGLETVDSFAKRHNATLAINGCGLDKDGEFYGRVIRDGKVYKDENKDKNRPTLAVFENGEMKFVNSKETADNLVKKGVKETFTFGISLVNDGEKLKEGELNEKLNEKHPRTAIGQNENGDYIILIADGRTKESEGLTPYEVADIMESKKCKNAIMLAGGGSSTLYFDGKIINKPYEGKTKEIAEIIYFN